MVDVVVLWLIWLIVKPKFNTASAALRILSHRAVIYGGREPPDSKHRRQM